MVPNGNSGVGVDRVDLGLVAVGGVSVICLTSVGSFEFRVFLSITLTYPGPSFTSAGLIESWSVRPLHDPHPVWKMKLIIHAKVWIVVRKGD